MIEFDERTGMPIYLPDGPVIVDFMSDNKSRVKIIQGPVGSGTSSACCMHIYQQALAQHKQQDGMQRFRSYVLRETYPKLEETTINTWLDWFPEKKFGRFYNTRPYKHEIRVGTLELDVIFQALEDEREAASFFKSLEPSLIWINEGQFMPFSLISEAVDRVSPPRFPAVKDGGCVWGGLILDTNAPPADHWIPIMRGDVPPPDWMTEDQKAAMKKPANWKFYMQPPGLIEDPAEPSGYRPNPEAENLAFLAENFYMEKIGGKTKRWIDANIMNRSAVQISGKAVYPDFKRDLHVAKQPLQPYPNLPLIVGLDFGRQPAALIMQTFRGKWHVLREIIGVDMPASVFAPILKAELATHFPDWHISGTDGEGRQRSIQFWGDPSGGFGGQSDDSTPFKIFRKEGLEVRPAPGGNRRTGGSRGSKSGVLRTEGVNAVLTRLVEGKPSLQVDPSCITYISGMEGGYHLRRLQVTGERYNEEPEKNQYSHICEAGEYGMLGGGEGRLLTMLNAGEDTKPKAQRADKYNPYKQRTQLRRF